MSGSDLSASEFAKMFLPSLTTNDTSLGHQILSKIGSPLNDCCFAWVHGLSLLAVFRNLVLGPLAASKSFHKSKGFVLCGLLF